MKDFFKNKKVMISFGITIIIIIILFILSFNKPKSQQEESQEDVLPKSEIIPTVDASVIVDLTSKNNKEVFLSVKNIPAGTADIEYELSYLARGDIPKGVIGTIALEDEKTIERKITLGTCSSGRCVYDQDVKKVKVSLKFNGDYGSRLFEKEFEI